MHVLKGYQPRAIVDASPQPVKTPEPSEHPATEQQPGEIMKFNITFIKGPFCDPQLHPPFFSPLYILC